MPPEQDSGKRELKFILSQVPSQSRVVDSITGELIANVIDVQLEVSTRTQLVPVIHLTIANPDFEVETGTPEPLYLRREEGTQVL